MEVAGVVIGFAVSTSTLLQRLEAITQVFEQVKDSSAQYSDLDAEIKTTKETLLAVRDLAEQQGTEEARVQTLAILAAESRSLGPLLDELEIRGSKMDSSSLWQRVSRKKVTEILARVKCHRKTLDLLLSTSGSLSPHDRSDRTNQGQPSGPSAQAIIQWLGNPDYSKRLNALLEQNVTGTGTWLLEDALFQQWLEEPGKPLCCTGQRELPVCIFMLCTSHGR
jgi:hypothetical protein